jgi:hypothetical protein
MAAKSAGFDIHIPGLPRFRRKQNDQTVLRLTGAGVPERSGHWLDEIGKSNALSKCGGIDHRQAWAGHDTASNSPRPTKETQPPTSTSIEPASVILGVTSSSLGRLAKRPWLRTNDAPEEARPWRKR